MRLTVVGCSGSVPGPMSAASCYLVEADGYRLVLDLGSGALGPLQKLVSGHEIDAIVLSHLHADHCLDMTSLSVLLRYGPDRPASPIPVFGPSGTAERLATAYDPAATPSMFDGLFEFRATVGPELGPLRMSTAPMNHPVPTVGVRIEHGGRSLVYSGDTGECAGLVELARDADVLLCEATWGVRLPDVADLHLSGRQAGEHAAAAGVRRLLLTHLPPWVSAEPTAAAAAEAFTGEIQAVRAGAQYDI